MLMRARRQGRRGQAMIEMAMLFPVLLVLFFGVYTASNFISNLQIAGQATRAGARLGAETGNNGYVTGQAAPVGCTPAAGSGTDPCIVDKNIVTSVLSIANGMTNVTTISEIDIYEPCAVSGSCSASADVCAYQYANNTSLTNGKWQTGDPIDVYINNGSGTFTYQEPTGDTPFTLDLRNQTHPNEAPIGVRILYTFHAPAPMTFFNMQASQYATMCMAPIEQE